MADLNDEINWTDSAESTAGTIKTQDKTGEGGFDLEKGQNRQVK